MPCSTPTSTPTTPTASTTCARCSCSQRQRIDVYLDERTSQTMHARFGYCFAAPPGSEYPPIVDEHRLVAGQRRRRSTGRAAPITALPFLQEHGDISSIGFRFGGLAYSCDLSGLPDDSVAALAGTEVWIIDALRYKPHPSHLSVDRGAGLDRAASSRAAPS